MPRGRSTTPRLLSTSTTMLNSQDSFDVSLDHCLESLKNKNIPPQEHFSPDDLELVEDDRQNCRNFHSWIKTHSEQQSIQGLQISECPMSRRAMTSNAKSSSTDSDRINSDETHSVYEFRSFLHAARKHAASTAAASPASSERIHSATNPSTSCTEDTESSDSDDEISDAEAMQLAARARNRSRGSASSISTTTSNAAAAAHFPPPSPAPQPHIDPEGFWKRREYEWSWTPESPSPTESVHFQIPTIVLTPAPPSTEEGHFDVLAYTQAWTPLQASVCPITARSLLTVPECFVLQTDVALPPPPQPECTSCSEPTQIRYRRACEDETGMAPEALAVLDVEEQRRRGVHGRMWSTYLGNCVCADWKAYVLACKFASEEEQEQETETSSEEEDSPASSPGMPCTPLSSAIELEESGEKHQLQGPRWMDFDEEDDELPCLDDWTT